MKLKNQIQLSFFTVILLFAVCVVGLGFQLIKNNIIERAQRQVKNDLKIAHTVYQDEIDAIGQAFSFFAARPDVAKLKSSLNLDYVFEIGRDAFHEVNSVVAREAFRRKGGSGGMRIIDEEELRGIDPDLIARAAIDIKPTHKAKANGKTKLIRAMAMEYALPLFDQSGNITSILYGGRLVNRDLTLVDKINDYVFENRVYHKKPVGTVTFFLDDVRIATNVLDGSGHRAIGTRVADNVYEKVINEGGVWLDRAYVVTDWYLTAYEPIKDPSGRIIGMFYVGILEEPFRVMERNISLFLIAAILLSMMVALMISYILSSAITRPLTQVALATRKFSDGELYHRIEARSSIVELNALAHSFNQMAKKLEENERTLKVSNGKLETLNKTYLDLIGFVAHELKAILSSAVLNVYSAKDGFLGMINFKQRKALDSVARNLDYLTATVKKFLNLSRIEKGELEPNKTMVLLREEVFEAAIDVFAKLASEKEVEITDMVPQELEIYADRDLLQIVANNLMGNAVKYATPGGKVHVAASLRDTKIRVEVYNDSRPLTREESGRLFLRFSRLDAQETRKVQGTGLGLFIAKEVVVAHAGAIWHEARACGNAFIFEIEKGVAHADTVRAC